MFFRKLSSKIFSVIFLGTLVLLVAVSFFTFFFTKTALQESIMSFQQEIARQGIDNIDRLLNERCSNIQVIAGVKPFEVYLSPTATEDMGVLLKAASRRLDELTVVTGPWDLLLITDKEGNIVLSSEEEDIGRSVKEKPQNRQAFENAMREELYYSDLVLSEEMRRSTIVFAVPVRDTRTSKQPVIGTAIGHFSWPAVLQVLEDIPEPAALLNHDGIVIGKNELFSKANPSVTKFTNPAFLKNLKDKRSVSTIILNEKKASKQKTLVSLGIQSGYLSYRGSGWGLVLEQPSNIVFAPARKTAIKLILFLVPIIILTPILLLVMLSRWVIRPVSVLTQTAREISAGNLNKKVPVVSHDEMGELAVSFNTMTERLQELYGSLETKVKERTKELENSRAKAQTTARRIVSQNSILGILAESGTLEDAAPKIIEAICIGLDWECGAIWNVDPDRNVIRCSYVWGGHRPEVQEFEKASFESAFTPGVGLPGRVWVSEKPFWISNVTQDSNFPRAKSAEKAGLHGAFAFPIISDHKTIGVFEFFSFDYRLPDDDLLRMMETIGTQIGQFIRHKKTEFQLLQSQKMETIGSLAGGVAHDLNNQLTPIRGYLDLLLVQISPGDPMRPLIEQANQAAIRCADVVQRLVSLSKGSTQKKTYFQIEKLLKELEVLLVNFLPATIRVQTRLEKDLWAVNGNETELHTVLMNLAANARDAMPDGGTLILEAKNVDLHGTIMDKGKKLGPHVVISVRDTGAGMFPETIKRIFEPFFTTKGKDKGTGLGLAMVFNIIKDHGGWIDVSSDVGIGTVFQIYLPAETQIPNTGNQETLKQDALPHGKETVLFADDEDRLRALGKVFLERLGYNVILASDGREAVEIYKGRKNEIDILIMDMTMPHLTGRQMLQKILKINPTAKIILTSGYTDEGTAEELMHDGARDFLNKPFTIMPLAQIVRKVLDT